MGEGRSKRAPGSNDPSGEVKLTDLAGPLAELKGVLRKLEASQSYKGHPGLYSMKKILRLLNLTYTDMVKDK